MKYICSDCKQEKEESFFSFKNKSKNIRNKKCKDCHKKYVNEHYSKNKKDYLERAKKNNPIYRKQTQEFLKEIRLKSECLECGENHPATLDFHHLIEEEKDFNISSPHGKSLQNIKKEIDKCIILCSNCHRKLHWSNKYKTAQVTE